MNLGVETPDMDFGADRMASVSAFSDESWGGDPDLQTIPQAAKLKFQHSLMNLGVETETSAAIRCARTAVSAFSDESWGGDPT